MDIISLTEKYGIAGLALIAPIPLYKYFWDKKKDIDSIPELKEAIENMHDGCKIPDSMISKMQLDIDQLKIENVKFDTQLVFFTKAITEMSQKLDKLIDFHMEK